MWNGHRPEIIHLPVPDPREGAGGVMEPLERSEFLRKGQVQEFVGVAVYSGQGGWFSSVQGGPRELRKITQVLRNEQE